MEIEGCVDFLFVCCSLLGDLNSKSVIYLFLYLFAY